MDAAYYALPKDERFRTDAAKALSARRLELATEVMKKPEEDAGYFGWPSSFDRTNTSFLMPGRIQTVACSTLLAVPLPLTSPIVCAR